MFLNFELIKEIKMNSDINTMIRINNNTLMMGGWNGNIELLNLQTLELINKPFKISNG